MNKYVYLHIEKQDDEILYYLNNILSPIRSNEIKPNILFMEIDEYVELDDIIKTIESDFFVDISYFVDEMKLENKELDIILEYINERNTGIYNLVDLLEHIVLENDKKSKILFKNLFENKLSKETIETGLGFIKYGNSITASKELFIHRNTLNYRLEIIKKTTSLDLKKFNDQLAFYGLFH